MDAPSHVTAPTGPVTTTSTRWSMTTHAWPTARSSSDEKGTSCAAFANGPIAYSASRGITRIERLFTDNAWAYRYCLREVCPSHGITQKFIEPHCP